METFIHAAPLQGFTDFRFRSVYHRFFQGVDHFYAPYIRLERNQQIKKSNIRDISPENNQQYNLIPQVLTNNADDFSFVAKYVGNLGYDELNWNLGCPYPMVTNRGMGAGMLPKPVEVRKVLDKVFSKTDLQISIKMRIGYENPEDVFEILPILNDYPIKNLTIHPRVGKQLYKGDVDLDLFRKCLDMTRHTVIYNGDIFSVEKYRQLKEMFPQINHWMIGRGMIADPFLPQIIKKNTINYPPDRLTIFRQFHDELLNKFAQAFSGDRHVMMKMNSYWEYWLQNFADSKKSFKKIKKAKSLKDYNLAIENFFEE